MNTALDTLSQALNIECCWVQTIGERKKRQLYLAAARGFSDEMRSEIVSMDMNHDFSGRIIGLGHKIVIPDLNNDGAYGLASFNSAGYKWLVAVPLMTYRVYGILGAASQNKRIFEKDTAGLVMVIAGLIAGALSKADFSRDFHTCRKPPEITVTELNKETLPADIITVSAPDTPSVKPEPLKNPPKKVDPVFYSHIREMESFRKSHR